LVLLNGLNRGSEFLDQLKNKPFFSDFLAFKGLSRNIKLFFNPLRADVEYTPHENTFLYCPEAKPQETAKPEGEAHASIKPLSLWISWHLKSLDI